jgi:ABC-2 type transport system ATP-binding protein
MLQVTSISKTFDKKRGPALQNVSFEVQQREIFGLLGHNGAGKSTALGIILGMVHPDSGEVTIDGISVLRQRSLAMVKVGAIFESPAFYDYLSGWKNLIMITSLSGIPDEKRMKEVVTLVGLDKRINDKVRTYSHGMRQRLAIAQALLPGPDILFFDEPTNGLDPDGIRDLRHLLIRLRDEGGHTIVFNSHLLSEVEQVCDRFAILKGGEKVFEGGKGDFQVGLEQWDVTVDDEAKALTILESFGGSWIRPGLAAWPREIDPAEINRHLVQAGLAVSQLHPRLRTLEELYLEVTNSGSKP